MSVLCISEASGFWKQCLDAMITVGHQKNISEVERRVSSAQVHYQGYGFWVHLLKRPTPVYATLTNGTANYW